MFIFEIGVCVTTLVGAIGEKQEASIFTWQNSISVGLILASMFLIVFMAGRDSKQAPTGNSL